MSLDLLWTTAFLDQPAATADASLAYWEHVTASTSSPPRGEHGKFRTLVPPVGDAYLRTQVVPDGQPRVHLDLHVEDLEAATREAVRLGAVVIAEPGTHVVLTSPGGMAFCLVPDDRAREVPPPTTWPSGLRSRLDQVCLDVPPTADYEGECAFWSGLTSQPLHDDDSEEFVRLVPPVTQPLGLLFQRMDEAPDGAPVTAHLDLAGGWEGADAEAERHRVLGAEELWRARWWITLRDPYGRVYCVTRREP